MADLKNGTFHYYYYYFFLFYNFLAIKFYGERKLIFKTKLLDMSVVTNIGKNTGHYSPASRSVLSNLKWVTSIQENPFPRADEALEIYQRPYHGYIIAPSFYGIDLMIYCSTSVNRHAYFPCHKNNMKTK